MPGLLSDKVVLAAGVATAAPELPPDLCLVLFCGNLGKFGQGSGLVFSLLLSAASSMLWYRSTNGGSLWEHFWYGGFVSKHHHIYILHFAVLVFH